MAGHRHIRMLVALAGLAMLGPVISAQQLTIRLVHGKTGKPMTNRNVTVTFLLEEPGKTGRNKAGHTEESTDIVLHIDGTGSARVDVPANATTFLLRGGPKMGKEPGRIPYTDCNMTGSPLLDVATVLRQGFVPGNECSTRLKIGAAPGEIVYFAMPLPWWKPDFQ
ncbi:hypothetical protein SAMN05421770_101786 [Granulicella rosea]|uniref:Uncharacterized protein n=1 Tax=Granulicella rosea TaxID=474952 RepID=A0A239E673_9BACT|nr:hypothetical protein [Granulicella rosea]SNS39384.1 hypothetical protein SAMN05421770_101786 [Granulicella rosea]